MHQMLENANLVLSELLYVHGLLFNLRRCIEYYFGNWLCLHREHSCRRSVIRWTVYTVSIASLLRAVQMLCLVLVPLSTHWRILLWDQFLFLQGNAQLNLVYFLIAPFCVFIYQRMYLYHNDTKQSNETVWLAYCLLHGNDSRFCTNERDRKVMQVQADKIGRITWAMLRSMQYYNKYFELIYLYYLVCIVMYIGEHWQYFLTTIGGYFSLAVIALNGLLSFLYIYMLIMEYVMDSTVGVVFTYATFVRLRRVTQLLSRDAPNSISPFNLNRFSRLHTRILLDIFEANRLYGPMLLGLMSAAAPTSAYQMVLLTERLSPLACLNIVNCIQYQVGIIFGFHLAAAMYSNRIHQCQSRLLNLCANQTKGKLPLRSLFRLALYTDKFHCKKRYGMTYTSYGVISFISFFKFTMLYSEFVMFCYRWIYYDT